MHVNSNLLRKILLLFASIGVLAMLAGCGGDDKEPEPEPEPADTTPDTFSFDAVMDADLFVVVETDSVTITGIDAAASVTVTGGEYAIDGGDFTSDAGTINNNQSVSLRLTTASDLEATSEAVLTVGGVSATFSVTTHDADGLGPIAEGQEKFLGGVCCGQQAPNFTRYWNQVTPENAGKWGSVEGTRDEYNWAPLDEVYAMGKDNGYSVKMHVLVWGNQQPGWIGALPPAEQLEEIQEWFTLVAERYPEFDYIEVVNEFDNDPPNSANNGPGYIDALRLADPETTDELIAQFVAGGEEEAAAAERAAEYDWIINSFQMARDTFPDSVKLMLNEYSVINTDSRTTKYLEIVDLLLERQLIDAIGFQGHAFSTGGPNENMINNMDRLATAGLDLFVTELDIDGPTDLVQLIDYQRIFPMFWEHEAVKGITVWGYLPGHWRQNQGAHLADENGVEKPALTWMRGYVNGRSPVIADTGDIGSGEELAEETPVGTEIVTMSATAPAGGDIEWSILGGERADPYVIDPQTGVITVQEPLLSGENIIYVQAKAGIYTSMLARLEFLVPGEVFIEPPPPITYNFENNLQGWRVDFGSTEEFTVAHNADAQAAEVTPDWTQGSQFLIVFVPNSPLNFTGSSLEYTVTVSEAQATAGLMVRGVVQTGQPQSWTRIEGEYQTLVAGENTFTYVPVDDANNNLEVIERVAIQFAGMQDSGSVETILINNVSVTFDP